jgi:hypothetical protein
VPTYRENTAKQQQSGRDALAKAGVAFVDVPQPELDKTREKMLPEQEKLAADSKMSPELVKLVMADVGA